MFYNTLSVRSSHKALSSLIIACACSNSIGYVSRIFETLEVSAIEIAEILNVMYAQIMNYPNKFDCKSCEHLGIRVVLNVPGPLFQFKDEVLDREQRTLFKEANFYSNQEKLEFTELLAMELQDGGEFDANCAN